MNYCLATFDRWQRNIAVGCFLATAPITGIFTAATIDALHSHNYAGAMFAGAFGAQALLATAGSVYMFLDARKHLRATEKIDDEITYSAVPIADMDTDPLFVSRKTGCPYKTSGPFIVLQ